jgi:PTH1 family peptidyl-tRNA hydrolase
MESCTGRPAWLVVGLGNPGPAYLWTPHNLGFMVVDAVAARAGIAFNRHSAGALVGRGRFAGVELVLAKPQTYMNASGGPVRSLLEEYGLPTDRLIVISDDVALPWGTVRIRERGSAGGHNGLRSVIAALGTDRFLRLRVGIGPGELPEDLTAYVLRPLERSELPQAAEAIDTATAALECILVHGAAAAMNRFNRRAGMPAGNTGAATQGGAPR